MAELHYTWFSGYPFLYSSLPSASLLRLWDRHLPFKSARDFIFSKKTFFYLRRDVNSDPSFQTLVCYICTYPKTPKAARRICQQNWSLTAAFRPTTQSCKRSGRNTPCTFTHSRSCWGLVQNNNALQQTPYPPSILCSNLHAWSCFYV